jgi:hypothetical protein
MHVSPNPPGRIIARQRYIITLPTALRSPFPVVDYIKLYCRPTWSLPPASIDLQTLTCGKFGSIVIRMAAHNFVGP